MCLLLIFLNLLCYRAWVGTLNFILKIWRDALCHSAAWLTVWHDLICTDWCSCDLRPSKIDSYVISTEQRGELLLGCCWGVLGCSWWKHEHRQELLRSALVTVSRLWRSHDGPAEIWGLFPSVLGERWGRQSDVAMVFTNMPLDLVR